MTDISKTFYRLTTVFSFIEKIISQFGISQFGILY